MQISNYEKSKLNDIKTKYNEVCKMLTYQEVLMDTKLSLNYQKQKNNLEPIALKFIQIENLENLILEFENLKSNSKDFEDNLYEQELNTNKKDLEKLQSEILKMLAEFNAKNSVVLVEILSKQQNNKLFLDLVAGYNSFCKENSLICVQNEIKNGVSLQISGLNAKNYFLKEVGIHVSSDNKYSCQVFVIVESNTKDQSFNLGDVEISTMRSSGAGGQHVNTTDSAIRVTHKKTGIVCVCQNERSQFQNKQKALDNLKIKVEEYYQKQTEKDYISQKKLQMKCSVIKTYDYDQNKIFKINKADNKKVELNLKEFLQGNIL